MRMFPYVPFGGDSINSLTGDFVHPTDEKETLSAGAVKASSAEPSLWLPFDRLGTQQWIAVIEDAGQGE